MSGGWSYDRLPSIHESIEARDQDITDANHGDNYDTRSLLRPLDSNIELRPLSISDHDASGQHDTADRSSVKSFETFETTASGSSFGKGWKNLGARIRRKPLPRYLRGSIRRHAAADIQPARIGRGVWKDQLLSDRSFRSMAALMTVLAFGMIILVACYAKHFKNRANRNTSSVGGDTESCKKVTHTNTALLLLINVCATMVLGMSNTYQQLVTSLTISDLKHVLSKFGDSRVGTNSPFSIKHKQKHRKRSWAAWVLLIFTSMPVHFLANSLIGPSYTQQLPTKVDYIPVSNMSTDGRSSSFSSSYIYSGYRGDGLQVYDSASFPCWSAFRSGAAHFPRNIDILLEDDGVFGAEQTEFDMTWTRMQVHYMTQNCTDYLQDTSNAELDALENGFVIRDRYYKTYGEGNCYMGYSVFCTLHDPEIARCRLNVRMSAAFTLMACLVIKAIYMVAINITARGKLKEHCLTFGDVIVASASNPELRVQGECMVNAGDCVRRLNKHTCHKHCFNTEESKTGDEIGHCQKCKKWNSNDKFAQLPQPTIATKFKKGLINNLGNTALTQITLLMFCSLALLGASLMVAVPMGIENESMKKNCRKYPPGHRSRASYCSKPEMQRFEEISGGFGGFNRSLELASLPPDSLKNEFISFSISNGAQFIYSLLYLMMIYNITLISQEYDWGKLEYTRRRIRTTLVAGSSFSQDYLLQLPRKILFPIMFYSVLTHWMLGEALQTQEAIWLENTPQRHIEHSKYIITYAAYPLWIATFLILLMTGVCWWAFTFKREGFVPQMFGSIRVLMASTTVLDDFPENGVQWGDLGMGKAWRHAGLSAEEVMKIVPNELYAGVDGEEGGGGEGREEGKEKEDGGGGQDVRQWRNEKED